MRKAQGLGYNSVMKVPKGQHDTHTHTPSCTITSAFFAAQHPCYAQKPKSTSINIGRVCRHHASHMDTRTQNIAAYTLLSATPACEQCMHWTMHALSACRAIKFGQASQQAFSAQLLAKRGCVLPAGCRVGCEKLSTTQKHGCVHN